MLPQISHRYTRRELLRDERPDAIGEEHLTAMTGGCNTRRTVDVQADVVVTTEPALASVQAHAYPKDRVIGPRVSCKRPLRVNRRAHRC